MTNPQVEAARKVMNKHRATIKFETVRGDVSETLTPYLIADPTTRGTSVTITKETPVSEVTRLFTDSMRSII